MSPIDRDYGELTKNPCPVSVMGMGERQVRLPRGHLVHERKKPAKVKMAHPRW